MSIFNIQLVVNLFWNSIDYWKAFEIHDIHIVFFLPHNRLSEHGDKYNAESVVLCYNTILLRFTHKTMTIFSTNIRDTRLFSLKCINKYIYGIQLHFQIYTIIFQLPQDHHHPIYNFLQIKYPLPSNVCSRIATVVLLLVLLLRGWYGDPFKERMTELSCTKRIEPIFD